MIGRAALAVLMLAAPATASPRSDEALVRDFYHRLVDLRDVGGAFACCIAADYIEHSGDVPGGTIAANIAYMTDLLAASPLGKVEVLRTASADGLVFLHARFIPAPAARPIAIVEIFRVARGKIVEHWDVIAPVRTPAVNPVSPF